MPNPFERLSLRQLIKACLSVFTLIWATQMYGVVANHPVLAWLYIPTISFCSTQLTYLALFYVLVLIVCDAFAAKFPFAEAGLAIQTAAIVLWACRKTLLRQVAESTIMGRAYRRLLYAARPCLFALGIVVACGTAFRGTETAVYAMWSVCMFSIALAIPKRTTFRFRAALANVAMTCASVAFATAILEGGARVLFPMAKPVPPVSVYDPDAWWTLGPNSRGEFQFPNNPLDTPKTIGTFTADTSSQGLRDRDYGPKQPNEYRILLMGDSFTYGWGVNEDDMISRRLEAYLNDRAQPRTFTVINGGDEGYGPWQERIRLNRIGFALEPDMVILQLFPANDIDNSLAKVGKHMRAYSASWQQVLQNRRHWGAWQVRAHEWMRRHSAVYNRLLQVTGRPALIVDVLDAIRFLEPSRIPPPKPSADRPFWLEIQLKDWYEELKEGQAILESDVLAMRDDCRARSIEFLVYTVPDINSVCDFSWEWNMNSVEEPSLYERGMDIKTANEFYVRKELDYIDLPAAMLAYPDPCALYFGNDGHLTPKGTDFAAKTIAQYLAAHADKIGK